VVICPDSIKLQSSRSENELSESKSIGNRSVRRIFLLAVLLGILAVVFSLISPFGPTRETFVEIAPGTSSRQIAKELQQQGIIRTRYAFDVWRVLEKFDQRGHGGGTLKAGEYRFDHRARVSEVYDRIRRGDVFTIAVTIPEGSNLFDIAAKISAAQLGTPEAFEQAARRDTAFIADLDPRATSLEGYLFPDTYHFGRKATPEQMLAVMVKRFRLAATSLGLQGNLHRVVTLASLVERETPIDQERPLVASVLSNRLDKGMPLMTDPSVIYAAILAGRYRGTIYASDLAADSPYNTYKRTGLPPGPICNPGAASLRAAMAPASTSYLYFVAASADPSGHSRFATTLEEHERNVLAYRRATHEASSR
jgi:UPF0755 protein